MSTIKKIDAIDKLVSKGLVEVVKHNDGRPYVLIDGELFAAWLGAFKIADAPMMARLVAKVIGMTDEDLSDMMMEKLLRAIWNYARFLSLSNASKYGKDDGKKMRFGVVVEGLADSLQATEKRIGYVGEIDEKGWRLQKVG